MIEALAYLLVLVAAFAFGYHTGYGRGRDDSAFGKVISKMRGFRE
jgi:hypothetical protein